MSMEGEGEAIQIDGEVSTKEIDRFVDLFTDHMHGRDNAQHPVTINGHKLTAVLTTQATGPAEDERFEPSVTLNLVDQDHPNTDGLFPYSGITCTRAGDAEEMERLLGIDVNEGFMTQDPLGRYIPRDSAESRDPKQEPWVPPAFRRVEENGEGRAIKDKNRMDYMEPRNTFLKAQQALTQIRTTISAN